MVDEDGYCTDCDSSDCLHAQLDDALAQVAYWKRKATERKVEVRSQSDELKAEQRAMTASLTPVDGGAEHAES